MPKKLSLILIAILFFSMAPLFSANSQPNPCINLNGIKTSQLEAQFDIWLNEPNGLNARFLDGIESSQERGERLFYNLVLNNNRICLSDLNQDMINSIIWVIRSYDNSTDLTYPIGELTISRSEINLALKSIRNPIIQFNPSLFAEAIQFSRPELDHEVSAVANIFKGTGGADCATFGTNCFEQLDEVIRDDSDFIESNTSPTNSFLGVNMSDVIDPSVNIDHFLNYTYGKDSGGGKQIDFTITLRRAFSSSGCITIYMTQIHVDIPIVWTQNNRDLTVGEASSIINYNSLCVRMNYNAVGGGGGREARTSWVQWQNI